MKKIEYSAAYIREVMEQVSQALDKPLEQLGANISPQEASFKALLTFLDLADLQPDLHQAALVELGILAEAQLGIFSGQIPTILTAAVDSATRLTFKGHFRALIDQDWRVQIRNRFIREQENVFQNALFRFDVSPDLIWLDENDKNEGVGTFVGYHMQFATKPALGWGINIGSSRRDHNYTWLGVSSLSKAILASRNSYTAKPSNEFNYTFRDKQHRPEVTAQKLQKYNTEIVELIRSFSSK